MILFSQFGYALRHSIKYDPRSKPGNLKLWSSYNGSGLGTDPIKNGSDSWTEILSNQFARSPMFGANIYANISLGNDDDLFSILAATVMVKNGRNFSFKNYAGRMISFHRTKVGSENNDVVLVEIRHHVEKGILMMKEVDQLQAMTRSALGRLGHSDQVVAEKVKNVLAQFSTQDDENA